MNEFTHIYGLFDPRDNSLRYIGKADNPEIRLQRHCIPSRCSDPSHRSNWIRGLLALGLKPTIRIIETVPQSGWQESERCWIRHYRDMGCDLTNSAEGGLGGARGFTPDVRARIASHFTGKPAHNRGSKHTPETKAKMKVAQSKRVSSPRAKIWRIELPDGEIRVIRSLRAFALEIGMNRWTLSLAAKEQRATRGGIRIAEVVQ